jgi:hypothetical protein
LKSLLENPEYWLSRATEARAIAENLLDEASRAAMRGVAASYGRIAARAHRRAIALPRDKSGDAPG